MLRTDRRKTPRIRAEGLAYVNLEPDNGGIILNISEGGLCFHSTTPVQQTAMIRFWFAQRNHRVAVGGRLAWTEETGSGFIEAESELAWTDETRTRGGLKFINLPAGAREEIRNWISEHEMKVLVEEKPARSLPSKRETPSLSTNRRDTDAARHSSEMLGVLSSELREKRVLTGFSGGLAVGVLVSALVGGVFLVQSHRRELGESVIRFGERLAGRTWSQTASDPRTVAAEPPTALPEPAVASAEPRTAPVESRTERTELSRTQVAAPAPQTTAPEPRAALPSASIEPSRTQVAVPAPQTTSPEPRAALLSAPIEPSRTQAAAAPQTTTPEPHTASAEAKPVARAEIPVAPQEKVLPPQPAADKPHAAKLEAATAGTVTATNLTALPNTLPNALPTAHASSGATATSLSTPARQSVPGNAFAPTTDSSSGTRRAAPPKESANHSGVNATNLSQPTVNQPSVSQPIVNQPSGSQPGIRQPGVNQPTVLVERSKEEGPATPPEKYLEVAKFSDKVWADQTTDKLSQDGFPATVVQRNRFWKKSFQVLVGPYVSDPEAEAAHRTLASHGFSPRSFERGKRDFMLPRPLKLDGVRMPVGACVITWESYIPDAIVRFETGRGEAVSAEGKWVKREVKYNENAIVYIKNVDGSLNLIEIRFSGMGQALVFGRGRI